jgi:hypothetical protein
MAVTFAALLNLLGRDDNKLTYSTVAASSSSHSSAGRSSK